MPLSKIDGSALELTAVVPAVLAEPSIVSLSPPGAVMLYSGATPPTGWIRANGAQISRTTYSALFGAIGTLYGAGDGSSTFTLPDFRGEFLRCGDDGRGVDSGRTFGSAQGQDWKSFTMTNTGQNTGAYSHNDVYMGKSTSAYVGNLFTGYWSAPAAACGSRWDTSEIRPRNVALLACIKF
jgi:microcystin-dependent protein